ncbi:MAG: hypothetical protein HC781_22340 [Leptolyngbyaceae cyanobacterium CSU_1_4]|nr:hypothetical protein [Leptolyngbyaceae cyanobacterium CSU_1_4]
MSTQQQVALRLGREPLQITVPENFTGKRSSDETEIFLSTQFHPLTFDEIDLCSRHIDTLPYKQSLVKGAIILDPEDPLLSADHEKLNKVERESHLPNSEFVLNGGKRSIIERVLLIREQGVLSNGDKQLTAG